MGQDSGSQDRRPPAAGAAPWGSYRGFTCKADGCDQRAKCKGYCGAHYQQQRYASGYKPPSANPHSRRAARIKHRYGITLAQYDALVAAQDGRCAICGEPPGANVRSHWGGKLCIDHDAATGAIRGLLCNDCNLVVGYGKTPAILTSAAAYLRDHP